MNARAHLHVRGRVQGVWYRASTRDAAAALALTGWVRNCADGSVEALAEGPREAVEQLVAWCRTGPPAARVDDVEVDWSEALGDMSHFDVRR